MLSETFIINSVRDGDRMKIVLKEFNQSFVIPQSCWREFVSLLPEINLAIEDAKFFQKSFGDGFYVGVNCNCNVLLESSTEKIVIGQRHWNKILSYLPELTSAIPSLFEPELDLLRNQLKTEQERRQEIELELMLTKQQLAKYTTSEMKNYSERRRLALARYKLEYELEHPNTIAVGEEEGEDEID